MKIVIVIAMGIVYFVVFQLGIWYGETKEATRRTGRKF